MATKFLIDVKLVSSVRNILVYTGKYQGKKVSVMGHGMGISSIGIYAHELFAFYQIERLIRVGSCGSFQEKVKVGDIVIAESALGDNDFPLQYGYSEEVFYPATKLLDLAKEKTKTIKNLHIGKILASQWFYHPMNPNGWKNYAKQNCLVVEMESNALYAIAKYFNKEAISILTVSDSLVNMTGLAPEQREKVLTRC